MKKRVIPFLLLLCLCLTLCACGTAETAQSQKTTRVVATTYPVYVFTSHVIDGLSGIELELLVDQSISCLHDYSLSTADMKKVDRADVLVTSGAGLEIFLSDITASYPELTVVDSSEGIELRELEGEEDPHIWLNPDNAAKQTENIAAALGKYCPEMAAKMAENAAAYGEKLAALRDRITGTLAALPNRQMITFHDGFGYFADAFDLEILRAIEEESGSEASAKEISQIVALVKDNGLKAIFTEVSGSSATALAIARETGVSVGTLDMIMSGSKDVGDTDGYLEAMEANANALLEALGS